jgi:hypothetical protein
VLLLLCSWFTQVVMFPHTWLAHWLAVRLAWVDDELDPLELDPPLQAAKVTPAANATAVIAVARATDGRRANTPMRNDPPICFPPFRRFTSIVEQSDGGGFCEHGLRQQAR